MPYDRPSFEELIARTEADIASRMGLGTLVPRGFLKVVARAHASLLHGLYGFVDWASRQTLPSSGDTETLERWADDLGVPRKAATYAEGSVEFTGQSNVDVPIDTVVQRADGARFIVLEDGILSAGAVVLPVRAELAGVDGNTPTGATLSLVSPVAGVDSSATVEAPGLEGAADEESDADLLVRVLQRLRNPPLGGAAGDYVRWALEVAGVTRAWCLPEHLGAGTVGVTFAVDDDPTGPIPGAPKVAEVQAYIDTLRPVPADVTVFAPGLLAVDLEFSMLDPDTQAVRDSIEAALRDLILREGAPGEELLLSHVREAISNAPGEHDFELTTPAANVALPAGTIPALGVITWPT